MSLDKNEKVAKAGDSTCRRGRGATKARPSFGKLSARFLSDPLHCLLRNFPYAAFILLWSFALLTLIIFSLLYVLRCLLNFQSVRFEFSHHWAFSIPVVALDVKIYRQLFTKGKRFLSMVANPTSQLSVIGNLVGARAAPQTGWMECTMFLFCLGIIHYLVLFVTLYQRLQGNDRLPMMLRPVFFLFVAAPSMASLAWDSIAGTFDMLSNMFFFLSLFIFASLVRQNNGMGG
ncbi:S-type anion channel SLAH1 [Acorus gramineus]|uniref:S-type anion channel SLAH1 n=1 Tax=Acorus gramineus TaxID=55184 RepID=A0AAV9A3Y7_ACOGR|nr:S-type anion channel SLAH1 [Acorus gramineus]